MRSTFIATDIRIEKPLFAAKKEIIQTAKLGNPKIIIKRFVLISVTEESQITSVEEKLDSGDATSAGEENKSKYYC